jgi:TatD DNase family protein
LIDIGVNFTNKRFDKDRSEVIQRAINNGISALLVTGTNIEESKKALALCQQFPHYLACTAGVHPHDADHVSANYLEEITELASYPHVKAIGECGLDFNRNFSTPEQQLVVFEHQIALAITLELPLFLHQRDAFEPWFGLLKPALGKVPAMVSHCFTGNKQELDRCLAADMYIGITGWLCDERRGQGLRDIIQHIPLNRLMIETDSPYLTPRTVRPKPKSGRNEPAYLPYVVKAYAEITGLSSQEIIEQSRVNAQQVFDLPMTPKVR